MVVFMAYQPTHPQRTPTQKISRIKGLLTIGFP